MNTQVSYRGTARLACTLAALATLVVGSATVSAKTTARGVPTTATGAGNHRSSTALPSANTLPSGYKVVSSRTVAAPHAVTLGSVTCPSAGSYRRFPSGGGVLIPSNDPDASIHLSYPNGTAWYATVNNVGSSATTFKVWAVCVKPKATYSQVNAVFDNPPGSVVEGVVGCPAGTKVLGGGAWNNPETPPELTQRMTASIWEQAGIRTNGWAAWMEYDGGGYDYFRVFATCEKYSPSTGGYAEVLGTPTDNPPGAETGAGVSCPAGDSVLGGGVYNETLRSVSLTSDWPDSGTSWFGYVHNGSGLDNTTTAYAVCAH